jgi:hypothetical protein
VAKAIKEEVSAAVKGSGVVGGIGIGVGDGGGGQEGEKWSDSETTGQDWTGKERTAEGTRR